MQRRRRAAIHQILDRRVEEAEEALHRHASAFVGLNVRREIAVGDDCRHIRTAS